MKPLPPKPTREELAAAHGTRRIRDIVGTDMAVLFVGINPGLYSAATKHHFARPGNRFWPALHQSGFTPRQLHPSEDGDLLKYGLGMSKVSHRATATAAELTEEEVRKGGAAVRRLVRKWKPRAVCFLGVGAYCQAYGLKKPTDGIGRQREPFEGSDLWVLPNPSGLNANYQLPDYVRMLRELRESLGLKAAAE